MENNNETNEVSNETIEDKMAYISFKAPLNVSDCTEATILLDYDPEDGSLVGMEVNGLTNAALTQLLKEIKSRDLEQLTKLFY